MKTLLISGLDIWQPDVPDHVELLRPPIPLPALDDFRAVADRSLEQPVAGEPLSQRIRPNSRVTVVLDDPSFPVPPPAADCRREMLEAALDALKGLGVRSNRILIVVANGLSRQWRRKELEEVLGPFPFSGDYSVTCHDAESSSQLVRLGQETAGSLELNRAVVETDLLLHLSVVSLPVLAGYFGLVSGTAGYRTARILAAPALFEGDASPLAPGSAFHEAHERVGRALEKQVPILQLAAVLNTDLWPASLSVLLKSESMRTRSLQMWNSVPSAVRQRAARLLKASYRPIGLFSGPPAAVAPLALGAFYRQHEVTAQGEASVLIFGVPDLGPASVHGSQNPILAASLALGYVSNLFTGRPLLKKGGVLIFANPLNPTFDRSAHLAHEEFYEKVLRSEREPAAIHERFEPYFAGRPEFVASYQRRFAFHGTHPLYAWYLCTPARRRAGRIIVAHGDPRTCARLGFTPAKNIEEALQKAGAVLGEERPSTTAMEVLPAFWVRSGDLDSRPITALKD